MSQHRKGFRHTLLGASALAGAAALAMASPALGQAREVQFDLEPQPLSSALREYGFTADQTIIFADTDVRSFSAPALKGRYTPDEGLSMLLAGTGLIIERTDLGIVRVRSAQAPQGGSGAGGAATVEALIVTAQKREEDIQDVPIAISAFTQEDLERSQIAGGPDLITQIPNFSFTKTNFSSYSIQIRGIGTQAVSATTDPGVAVAFNNTPFIRNRFFEQEFYDLQRVEVLRGPQGTLYGRNATAGVVNIISAKPKFFYEAKLGADVANYNSTRLEGMVNIPLVEDAVALRVAGAWTKRDGFAFNEMTGRPIDGRDLWSTRVSLRFAPPGARFDANLIWEHFEENDDRLRSGKQLCKQHRPTEIAGATVSNSNLEQRYYSQGCERVSLYSEEAFQTPNGQSLPYVLPLRAFSYPVLGSDPYLFAGGPRPQSRDLRVIESTVEPDYRSKVDIAELQVSIDLTDSLTLASETAYGADSLWSLQDYNRFTTRPIFAENESRFGRVLTENGVFVDPQLGPSDRLLLVDLSTEESTQFSQEFRLSSDYDGAFNFSLGANFLRHDALAKYYVFINTLSLWGYFASPQDNLSEFGKIADPTVTRGISPIYVDPNPIGALNDMGRNYFLSKNPYKLISYAAFGEAYYNVNDALKITAGLRFTVDRKQAPQIPSWLLAQSQGGPYAVASVVNQEWREPTGRLAIDWKPVLGFTDETLVYASYAHGYKAGGANPPPPVFATYGDLAANSKELFPDTFDAEFVDAFEIGTKNTLADGRVTLNLAAFYYDYESYQVSEIRNRSAVNSNYDAEVWGVEIEADWRPLENLKLAFKGGYNGTRIADGEESIDLMDRAGGDPNWVTVKSFPAVPSNCILPAYVVTAGSVAGNVFVPTTFDGSCVNAYGQGLDPVTGAPYVPNPYPPGHARENYPGFDPSTAPNGGKGIAKKLGGNELPNAPDFTATLTADYTLPLAGNWLATLHGDLHWQSDSWWRVFNDHEYNRLDEFYVINLAAIFDNEDAGWRVMAYIKNVLDNDAITGAFLNSDDSGLTTNVFLTEPRLYGLRVTKAWSGGPLLGTFGARRDGPYPFHVELGGGVGRFDADAEAFGPWVPDALAGALDAQEQDLDWGDTREVKLSYTPGDWRIVAGYRFGKANGRFRNAAYQAVPRALNAPNYGRNEDHAVSGVYDSEEYAVADFMVGKDVGIGAFGDGGQSVVSAGLRYAAFESMSRVRIEGRVDGYFAPMIGAKYGDIHWTNYRTDVLNTREFEGVGPALSWESSLRLAGDDHGGHADLDWKVGGAVLFGKQTTERVEDRFGRYYQRTGTTQPITETTLYDDVVTHRRTNDVTVPNVSLNLGLSYSVDRVKVSTGYSYDRFFDAIDGGIDEATQFDRMIQGPYFKLSVGFGGG